jgi:HAMP domain-containing protein
MRLYRTIVLLIFMAVALPLALVLGAMRSISQRTLRERALDLSRERTYRLRLQISERLTDSARALEGLTLRTEWAGLNREAQRRDLEALLAHRAEISLVSLVDATGHALAGTEVFPSAAVHPQEQQAQEQALVRLGPVSQLSFSSVHSLPGSNRWLLTMVVPLARSIESHRAGNPASQPEFLAAEISLRSIQELVERLELARGQEALLVDSQGRLLATTATASGRQASLEEHPAVAAFLRQRAELEARHDGRAQDFAERDGHRVLGAFALVPGPSFGVIFEEQSSAAMGLLGQLSRLGVLGLLLGVILAGSLGLIFARSIVAPIRRCVAEALDISRGIFGGELKARGRNEIGDLTHSFNYMSKQLQAYDIENRGLYRSLEKGYLETIVALANSIDSKDSYTRGHSQRVADLSVEIGRQLGLGERELKHLAFGGILHDIGKIGIVEKILLKQTLLTDDEMLVMREHPAIGAGIIEPVAFLDPVLAAVRNHHERWDGTGYPDQLKGTEIPLVARIVNAADTWDACTSTRPYQSAKSYEDAVRILENCSGTQCDPEVVQALFRAIQGWRAAGRPVTAGDPITKPRVAARG